MDANERESRTPDDVDMSRKLVLENEALAAVKPKRSATSWVVPFLASVLVTGLILAAVYYFWGR
jgi:hypothetical protein